MEKRGSREQEHYVLLVEAISDKEDETVYQRVGVAILESQHIALDGKEKSRMAWIK